MPETTRQLAAIMFTDIVGYTALMGKDSEKALDLIRVSKEIQKPLVEKHNGKWLKEMGDGAMAQFSTASDAVNCALEIQRLSRADFDAKLRIGIHLGDVTIENDDVYGDGVNVASRLESITDPGGIYISESIEKAIQGQTDVQAKYLGEAKLKNVAYGVRIYALQGVGLPIPEVKGEKEMSGRFWAELQRRSVLRVALTYIMVSWLLLQIGNMAFPVMGFSSVAIAALSSIVVFGFPVAIFLAWNFERSPEGFVRTTSQASWQNPYTASQRKPLTGKFIIVGLVLVILAMYVYPRYLANYVGDTRTGTEVTIDDKSIAVLPFVNMSGDPDQLYFSDGVMGEILNHLTRIKELKVISRTSVMQYRDTKMTIPQIARELGVAYILEGGVQRYQDQVRINTQLIDAKTDRQVWSENYDREFTNIFVIQSEVAQQIANILQATISPEVIVQLESKPTENMEAYNLYLEAMPIIYNSFDLIDYPKAYELLEKAIALDPYFALAYTEMARYWFLQGIFTGAIEREKILKEALPLLEKSLELDDKEPVTHLSLAFIYLYFQWDFEKAEMEFNKIRELPSHVIDPNYLLISGRYQEALVESTKRTKNDMNNPFVWAIQGLCLYFNDHSEESLATFEWALKKFPNDLHPVSEVGRVHIFLNEYHEVIKILEPHLNKLDRRPPRDLGNLAIAHYKTNQNSKSDDILEELKQMSQEFSVGSPAFYIAMLYAQMGEINLAFEWLEKAYQEHEVEMVWLKVEPPFEPLRSDPRWQEMLNKVGFPE